MQRKQLVARRFYPAGFAPYRICTIQNQSLETDVERLSANGNCGLIVMP
jgi:hypothetical protein